MKIRKPQLRLLGYRTREGEFMEARESDIVDLKKTIKGKLKPVYQRLVGRK